MFIDAILAATAAAAAVTLAAESHLHFMVFFTHPLHLAASLYKNQPRTVLQQLWNARICLLLL